MHKAICTVCGQAYGGFAAHSLTKTEAKAATYTETGNNEYYTCSVCQKVFKDAAGTQETTVEAETIAKLTRPSSGGSSSHGDRDPSYAVTAPSTKNGDVTVSPKNASKGDRVTITVTSDKGYELDKLIVKDASGNKLKLTDKGNGKYTFTMPGSKVTVEATFTLEKEENLPFADVAEDYWAVEEITWAYENGYMNGVSAERFAPGSTVTRQQLWMVLARLTEFNPSNMTEAQHWAVESKISDGSNPGGALTRQQMVTILYRWAQQMGYDVSGRADLSAFPDNASVAAYATEPMTWAIAEGIISGTTEGLLNPAGTATRAQFAVILYRFFENVM